MFDQLQQRQSEAPPTFAEPGEGSAFSVKLMQSAIALTAPFNPVAARMVAGDIRKNLDVNTDLFTAAERQQRTVENVFAATRATEEVYDRWIARVRTETGVELENPLRGGYRSDAMRAIRDEVRGGGMASIDGLGGVPERQLQIFNQRLAEVQGAHPDKAEALTFGDVREEARGIAREAEAGVKTAALGADRAGANPVISLAFEFAGGMWAGRRDPIFVGSLFAGPTSAIGRTALTRIATSGLFQGFFNAGVSALEQPAVQAWRQEAGLRAGVMPAVENVGMAFLFGLIPGAALRGVHEQFARSVRAPAERIMSGRAEPGDADRVVKALGDVDPTTAAAVRMGEDIITADRDLTPRPAKNVTPELHDDLNAAALKHADDPVNSPSPEAVAFIDAYHGSPHDFEAFRMDRIGTGEGAQAYGNGLYFAENEGVSRQYARTTSERDFIRKVQELYNEFDSPSDAHAAIAESDAFTAGQKRLLQALEKDDWFGFEYPHQAVSAALRDNPRNWDASPETLAAIKSVGNMYRVRIRANRDHFLDWDKPLSEQSPEVQKVLRPILEKYKASSKILAELNIDELSGKNLLRAVRDVVEDKKRPLATNIDDAIRAAPSGAETSRVLREAGIPGIKYLDQGSRDAGEGSRNFVVFDDKLIEITHKNDTPVAREIESRIEQERPQSRREAEMIASEVIEEQGTRAETARLRQEIDEPALPKPPQNRLWYQGVAGKNIDNPRQSEYWTTHLEKARDYAPGGVVRAVRESDIPPDVLMTAQGDVLISKRLRGSGQPYEVVPLKVAGELPADAPDAEFAKLLTPDAPRRPARDPLEKIPFVRDDGTPTLLTRGQVAKVAERDTEFAMLIRSCK